MTKKCVVNWITNNSWHPFGQKRLGDSLIKQGFTGDYMALVEGNIHTPKHRQVPYAFKMHSIHEARMRGYEQVLWLDASFWAVREVESLFALIEEKGFVTQCSSYPVGQWCNDTALQIMGVSRNSAMELPMYSGGLQGYDFRQEKVTAFFNEYFKLAREGDAFKGEWHNRNNSESTDARVLGHRHDMPVGSILAHRYHFDILPNNSLFAYYGWYQELGGGRPVYFLIEGGTRELI